MYNTMRERHVVITDIKLLYAEESYVYDTIDKMAVIVESIELAIQKQFSITVNTKRFKGYFLTGFFLQGKYKARIAIFRIIEKKKKASAKKSLDSM